eukprot:1065048-Prorocentrum_minimum.AAC.1
MDYEGGGWGPNEEGWGGERDARGTDEEGKGKGKGEEKEEEEEEEWEYDPSTDPMAIAAEALEEEVTFWSDFLKPSDQSLEKSTRPPIVYGDHVYGHVSSSGVVPTSYGSFESRAGHPRDVRSKCVVPRRLDCEPSLQQRPRGRPEREPIAR